MGCVGGGGGGSVHVCGGKVCMCVGGGVRVCGKRCVCGGRCVCVCGEEVCVCVGGVRVCGRGECVGEVSVWGEVCTCVGGGGA